MQGYYAHTNTNNDSISIINKLFAVLLIITSIIIYTNSSAVACFITAISLFLCPFPHLPLSISISLPRSLSLPLSYLSLPLSNSPTITLPQPIFVSLFLSVSLPLPVFLSLSLSLLQPAFISLSPPLILSHLHIFPSTSFLFFRMYKKLCSPFFHHKLRMCHLSEFQLFHRIVVDSRIG